MRLERLVLLGVIAGSVAACGQWRATAPTVQGSSRVAAKAVPGELVVKFKDVSARQALMQKLGLKMVERVAGLDAMLVKATDPGAALKALQADSTVLYAEPNYRARKFDTRAVMPRLGFEAGDELLSRLWGMKVIKAEQAWSVTKGNPKVMVAVVDTGVDYNHPDFGGRVVKGRDFAYNDNDPMDDDSHGTHCAGSAAAGISNGGVVGVAPEVGIFAVKVLDKDGGGTYVMVANGIVNAANSGAPVISMSLGGSASSKVLEDAVKYAQGKGALIVAAMGNDASEEPSYPAAIPGVMAVGATNFRERQASFSNFGKHISVSAPGDDILSTTPGGKYESFSGTSMATPHVAGLAGLVKSRFPQLTADQLRARIESTSDDLGNRGFDIRFGHGRINAFKAVN
jgi:thermitase